MQKAIEEIRNKYVLFLSVDNRTRIHLFTKGMGDGLLLLLALFFMPLWLFLLLILDRFFKVKVRIVRPYEKRIGEMVHRTDLYLRRRVSHKNSTRELHLFLFDKPANRQLLEMIKRRVCVLKRRFLLALYSILYPYTKNSSIWMTLPWDISAFNEFNKVPPQFVFTSNEERKGQKELIRMGLKEEDSFVCFHARDKVYLDEVLPGPKNKRGCWSYDHDHRNSDIRNYLPAAEHLASLGLFAIRVGYLVERPIESYNPRIIDYATKHRSDFMDIYLLGKCKFLLGNNSGLHCVAQAFGIPVAVANWVSVKYAMVGKHDLFVPMKLWSIEQKRFLTFREIIESGIENWLHSDPFVKAGIEVIQNTPEDILALAKEMNARMDGTWVTTEEDEELQQRYKNLFKPGHYSYGFPSRIGTEFLRQNRELLD